MKGYVYRLVFEDGTEYVGRTLNIKRRLASHHIIKKKGIPYKCVILKDIDEDEFVVEDRLNKLERYYINKYKPELNKCRWDSSIKSFNHREDSKERIRQFNLGRKHSVESINKRSGPNAYQSKGVYSRILNKEFISIRDAAKFIGLKSSCKISQVIRGERKSAGKHPQTKEPITDWKFI